MDPPKNYLAVRITVAHALVATVEDAFSDCSWYILYPHSGKDKDNEHFHVSCPDATGKRLGELKERIRKFAGSGNGKFSVKRRENGVLHSITYMAKEGTQPKTRGDSVPGWISSAPVWVNGELGNVAKKRKRAMLEDPITGEQFQMKTCLVKQNLVMYMSFFWHRKCREDDTYPKDSKAFKRVIIDMMASGKYLYQVRDLTLEQFRPEFEMEIKCPDWQLHLNDFDYHHHEMTVKKMRHDLCEKNNLFEIGKLAREIKEVEMKMQQQGSLLFKEIKTVPWTEPDGVEEKSDEEEA